MAIAAATIYDVVFVALLAFVDGYAKMIRAAVDDSIDDLSMFTGHGITEPLDILSSMGLEDFFNRCHGHLLSSAR